MEYLEYIEISQFNSIIESIDAGPYKLSGRIEVFRAKKHSEELMREIDERYSQKAINIPTKNVKTESSHHYSFTPEYYTPDYDVSPAMSPFGPLTHEKSRGVFCDLIQCLNLSFPDYEFKSVDPGQFAKEESLQEVMNKINTSLRDAFTAEDRIAMWTLLSSVCDLQKCQVYSYHPEDEDDPLGVGNGRIWSWTYFFLNLREKKLIMFTCHAKSKHHFDESCWDMSGSDSDTVYGRERSAWYATTGDDDSDEDNMFEDDW